MAKQSGSQVLCQMIQSPCRKGALSERGKGLGVKCISLAFAVSFFEPPTNSIVLSPDFLNLFAMFLFLWLDAEPSCCKCKLSKYNFIRLCNKCLNINIKYLSAAI